jgi:hypothetical protein
MAKIDVYNENGSPLRDKNGTPLTEERDVVHRKGLWHRNTYVIPVTDDRDIVLFLRKKPTYKGMWVPIAEHPYSGEGSLEAAIRGVKEDIKKDISESDLIDLGVYSPGLTDTALGMRVEMHNEFQRYFAIRWRWDPEEIILGPENKKFNIVRPYEVGEEYVIPLQRSDTNTIMNALVEKGLINEGDLVNPDHKEGQAYAGRRLPFRSLGERTGLLSRLSRWIL